MEVGLDKLPSSGILLGLGAKECRQKRAWEERWQRGWTVGEVQVLSDEERNRVVVEDIDAFRGSSYFDAMHFDPLGRDLGKGKWDWL